MIILYFQLCYEDIFSLLGNNDGGERNLRATFHDKYEHMDFQSVKLQLIIL